MKSTFLVLLLLNLLYAGWRLWIVPSTAPPAFVEAQDVPRLELVDDDGEGVTLVDRGFGDDGEADAEPGVTLVDRGSQPAAAGEQPGAAETQPEPEVPETAAPAPGPQTATSGTESVVPPGDEPEDQSPPQFAALTRQPARCVSLGPFLNLREATEATAMLNEIGLQPNQRLAESQVWFGHWVHLPAQPSRAAAIAIVESLREKGVSDIYIEPSGPFRNFISLGVFNDAAHAETRAGQIRRLGISPQIRDRYRDSSVYWVDFALPAERDIDPAAYQASPSRVLRLESRDCPTDAAG